MEKLVRIVLVAIAIGVFSSISSTASAGPDIDDLLDCIEKKEKAWKKECEQIILAFSKNPDATGGKPKDEWSGFFDGVFAEKSTPGIGIWSRSPAELILGGGFRREY